MDKLVSYTHWGYGGDHFKTAKFIKKLSKEQSLLQDDDGFFVFKNKDITTYKEFKYYRLALSHNKQVVGVESSWDREKLEGDPTGKNWQGRQIDMWLSDIIEVKAGLLK